MAFVLAQERTKDPEADQSRLLQVHVVSLWEGFRMLGLVWAVALSDLSDGLETLAALLIVASAVLQFSANTIAWRQKIVNLFAPPRGITYQLAATNAVFAFAGLSILIVGALKGL